VSDPRESPELELLLHAAASDGSPAARHRTRELAQAVVSWPLLLERAAQHAVVPLMEQELGRNAADLIAPETASRLRAAAQEGATRSLRLTGDLVAVQRALASAGVSAIPFKGPTLAALVYGNLSLRQFEDLDILVRDRELSRARDALFAGGFSPVLQLSDHQRASIVLSGHHEQLRHAESGTTVELHWSLNNRALTHDAFEHHWWEELQPVSIGGVTMHTLGPERLLLYLCMHGGKHSWARLSWLCDLHRALRTYPSADWDAVWRLANENGAARMVAIGLWLVDDLFDGRALTATAWSGRHRDASAGQLCKLIAQRLRGEPELVRPLDFRVQLQSRERYRDRLRYTWHVLATPHPADVALLGLPRALHGLYYIARPLRLTWKYLSRRARPASAP
jgi:Uncharacterised nucleotidyltransferase